MKKTSSFPPLPHLCKPKGKAFIDFCLSSLYWWFDEIPDVLMKWVGLDFAKTICVKSTSARPSLLFVPRAMCANNKTTPQENKTNNAVHCPNVTLGYRVRFISSFCKFWGSIEIVFVGSTFFRLIFIEMCFLDFRSSIT